MSDRSITVNMLYDPGVDALGLELLAVQALLDIERDGIDDVRRAAPRRGACVGPLVLTVSVCPWCVNDCSGGRKPFTTRRSFRGGIGLPVGILNDLAGVLHAAAQRRNTGLKAFVDCCQTNEFLAEGRGIAQAEQHGVVVTVDLHIASEEASVAHDVVAVGVARGVELALAGDIQLETARARLSTTSGNHSRRGVLAGHVAVAGIVAVDKEARVGQANLVDHAAREHAALKAQLVHGAVALGSQVPLGDRVGNAERKDELVLPKEGPPSKSRREPWITS